MFRYAFIAVLLIAGVVHGEAPDPAVAPATVDPLPPGWGRGQFDQGDMRTGTSSDLAARFELTSTSQRDIGNVPLADWAKTQKDLDAKHSGLTNSHGTDLKPVRLGDHDALVCEVTGDIFDQHYHYRVFFASVRGVYCELNCWTEAPHWDAFKGQFDQLAQNLK